MDTSDLGVDLWALIYKLYTTNFHTAFGELCLRTSVSEKDLSQYLSGTKEVTLAQLKETSWYTTVKNRYAKLMDGVKQSHRSRFEEMRDMAEMLYPHGCSLSDYASAVTSCVSMLSFTIPETLVSSFLQKQDEILNQMDSYVISGESFKADVEELVKDSVCPRQWWTEGSEEIAGPPVVRLTRVALKSKPPKIVLEYEILGGDGKGSGNSSSCRRCRHINLPPAVLTPNYPVASVARHLVASHGMLLSEAKFQQLTIDLQRLEKQRLELESSMPSVTANKVKSSSFVSESSKPKSAGAEATNAESSRKSTMEQEEPQEADVCLLYRDPEAALRNVNLNKADDDTIKEFKEVMDIKFQENALKPGDPGYIYDKRIDVKPVAKSEWDDSDDD